jgi:tetratricopeptide (TPR) repeat protein
MLPPGESAYDLYRSALAIDGNNAAARSGLQDLPILVSRQLRQALANGNLNRADELLADLSELAPGDAGQDALRQRLGGAWLDQAEQQLARGDRAGATQSLQQARKIAPNHPRLQEVAARLRAGS